MMLHQALLLLASLVCVQTAGIYSWSTTSWPSVTLTIGSWSTSSAPPPPHTALAAYQAFGTGVEQSSVELSVTPSAMPASVVVPPSLLEAVQHQPTIRFVTSPTLGPFFMAFGITVPEGEAKVTVVRPDTCSCKVQCSSSSWCVAASGVVMSNGSVTCHLADHLPAISASDPSTAYYLFFDRLTDKVDVYTVKGNNEIYAVSQATHKFTKANAFCDSLPGFRLGIFITKPEVDVLLRLMEVVGVDLNVAVTRGPELADDKWTDGTKVDDSYLHYHHDKLSRDNGNLATEEPYYRLKFENKKLADTLDGSFRTACQGYLFR